MADSGELECDLDKPLWAVVNSRGVIMGNLIYKDAYNLSRRIESEGVCVISQEAASQISKKIA